MAQDKVLGGVFFSLETRLYNHSIILHQRPACEKKHVGVLSSCRLRVGRKLAPPPGGKSCADGRKRGGGGGTDVNTDKGWFECASAAKSGGGGEWQKKERKMVASGEEKERQE